MTLHDALGGMRALPQWFVWRLEWNDQENKYLKTPCGADGLYRIDASVAQSERNGQVIQHWWGYEGARELCARLNQQSNASVRYALGFWMTADCGYWFLDLDACAVDGVLNEFAAAMVAAFPGALMEWSSSARGVHIIGRGVAPAHRSRDVHGLHMEFYTEQRGIAFGLSGEAQGSADSVHDAMVAQLVATYFPPREQGVQGVGPRAEWRGPADDDALIERALAAKVSAAAAFGGKATFTQLWRGLVEKNNEHDMALASHLAYWTGCDEERMERLMRRSGMHRAKWDNHRTYLRELTIRNACAGCSNVYQEPQKSMVTVGELYRASHAILDDTPRPTIPISPETAAKSRELLDAVGACGTVEDMHNEVIPAIRDSGLPSVYCEQMVRAVNAKLDLWDAKLPVGKLRALLFPPVIAGSRGAVNEVPLWMQQHCYCLDGDFFFNCENGARLSHQGFIAEYARLMPLRENGNRENPVEWAFTRWNIRTVHRLEYRPDQGPYFARDGMEFANLYAPSSVPATASAYSPEGLAGIEALQRLLWDMCGRREGVYNALLGWLAHNVQKPGTKIRWSPIIKGCMGDGKSLVSNALRAAMGYRNVSVTGNSALTAQGGFNDWAVGAAVNVIEEIMLTGKERHRNYNAMNEFITNDVVSVNAKGARSYFCWNITNHLAYTNHNDALPLAKTDRRWLVIFTPWSDLAGMMTYCGLDAEGWAARTGAVDAAWKNHAGELRAWLLSVDTSALDIRGSALLTPEKARMMASGEDDAEAVAGQIIEEGSHGVCMNVLSSACLSNHLKVRAIAEGFEVPRSTALNHMLTRMGYSKISKQIKWRGATHTLWVKNGFSEDAEVCRRELDKHLQPNLQPTLTP